MTLRKYLSRRISWVVIPGCMVFLNLNTQDQIGGFSFKDGEYAAPVMAAFVNLLSP